VRGEKTPFHVGTGERVKHNAPSDLASQLLLSRDSRDNVGDE